MAARRGAGKGCAALLLLGADSAIRGLVAIIVYDLQAIAPVKVFRFAMLVLIDAVNAV